MNKFFFEFLVVLFLIFGAFNFYIPNLYQIKYFFNKRKTDLKKTSSNTT
jgi:hypothetical protein